MEGQNARNLKNHHPERNRTTDDIRTHKKTCPEETIYQIGTKDDYVDPDVLLTIVTEFITELSDRFGEHFHLLNWSLHLDESTPHIHERHIFDCKNAYGEIFPQQEKALETLGFELPNPEKKAGRFNNRKMVFDATCRILLFDICKKHGLELEEEPSYGGREYLEKQDYIRMKQKKDIASLEKSIQSQIEVVNHKKYEIFEQEVQYKENSIKIIDQERKLKAQSEEFFDNAERIFQQDETLKQLEFKIEDVEKLIDDVTYRLGRYWLIYKQQPDLVIMGIGILIRFIAKRLQIPVWIATKDDILLGLLICEMLESIELFYDLDNKMPGTIKFE